MRRGFDDLFRPGWTMLTFAVCLAFLIPATAVCLAYLVPALVGCWRTTRSPTVAIRSDTRTFAILIPAHNEATTMPAALESLAVLDYPADRVRVYVVADNCSDGTAEVARMHGAECVERSDPTRRGKGFAIAAGLERIGREEPDVVMILDA